MMERQINQDGDTIADAILEVLKEIAESLDTIASILENKRSI